MNEGVCCVGSQGPPDAITLDPLSRIVYAAGSMPPMSDTWVVENHVGARDERRQCLVGSVFVSASALVSSLSWCDGTALFLRWGLPVGHGVLEPTPNSVRSCVAPAIGRGSPSAFGFRGLDRK